jgi:hypothetical protein
MITLNGGCDRCGKLMQSKAFDPNTLFIDPNYRLICDDCYERFYSPEAIREKKLNQVLDKSVWSKLKSLFKK